MNCFIHLFPDEPTSRNWKTKEINVAHAIRDAFPDPTIIFDKKVSYGCSLRRPDVLLDFGDQVICVEVDENAHTFYDCSCENKRMMELSQDIGHRPLVIIRFNPDGYIDDRGKKIHSCWEIHDRTGVMIVKKPKEAEWTARLKVLIDHIHYWIIHRTEKTLEVIQLYYDCDNQSNSGRMTADDRL